MHIQMLSFFLSICVFLFSEISILFGIEESLLCHITQSPLFVSLGSNCLTAGMFRHFDRREAAFPFDWMVTTDDLKLIEILDHNFQDFTNHLLIGKHPHFSVGHIVNHYYHVEFAHDWDLKYWETPELFQEGIEKLKIKYDRKINRFRQLANYKGKVVFVRLRYPMQRCLHARPDYYWYYLNIDIDQEELALQLNNALKKMFPSLDFKLVIITQSDTSDTLDEIDNVMIYSLVRAEEHSVWKTILDNVAER
ncbi:MAG TPA: DUF1796 family putative cysteine peptidase [Rhabdochlamydiaceae bacterium]|nr:DUF1796 family putative cysteine peptidase [Rhabdochlamydiaceae bacterium]